MFYDYVIANLRLRSDIDLVNIGIKGFRPFAVEVEGAADCTVECAEIDAAMLGAKRKIATAYLAEANADSCLYTTDGGYLYSVLRKNEHSTAINFYIESATGSVKTDIKIADSIDLSILRFGLWVMFGVVLAKNRAIAIHSSTIVSGGYGVLFLGESGTGKSTHTRLWRENITDAKLLNDDSPIVRMVDGRAVVFGSPWSGKTPCYKNESYPIGGFCRLEQAPYNKIHRLNTVMSICALLPSCPPMFAHDEYLQDCICATLSDIISKVPVYKLQCLPDPDAAILSHSTMIPQHGQ